MKTFSQFSKEINEGTWAVPDTPKKRKAIYDILAKPLKAKDASEKLYNLLGDDKFFDDIADLEKKNPNADARPLLKKHLDRMMRLGAFD